jgi:hypothetical protein
MITQTVNDVSDGTTGASRRNVENKNRLISEYTSNRVIGTGTFGKVFLSTLNGKGYAIKVLQKRKILDLK